MLPVYIYDPTKDDTASKVRGVGRYVEVLRDYLHTDVHFTSSISEVPYESVFITPFYTFLQKSPAQRKIARKQLAVIHDLIPQKYPTNYPIGIRGSWTAFTNRLALSNFDGIITDSNASKQDITDILGINTKNVHILYPVVSKGLLKHLKKPGPVTDVQVPYFLYVGDATWNKNIKHIAQAIKIANVRCVFVGSVFQRSKIHTLLTHKNAWLKELQSFSDEIENDERFILPGFVTDAELAAYYANATANLLVSRDEGFGYSFLEAAYAKCPSVLADEAIFHETAGEAALFANPDDPIDISQKIKSIQQDPVRKKIKELLPSRIEMFNPKEFASAFYSILSPYRK